jgi:hypothetical protein
MTDLSPAARAVLDAANGANSYGPDDCLNESRWIAAAALRAVADEVAPETPYSEPDDPDMLKGIWDERRTIRAELLAIAAELEGAE